MGGLEDKIYTVDETAEYLRWTRRGLIKVAKRLGLCMVRGREVTFTKSHILGIIEALQPAPNKPRALTVRGHIDRAPSGSASPKIRKLFLQRSNKPWAKRLLKEEFGE